MRSCAAALKRRASHEAAARRGEPPSPEASGRAGLFLAPSSLRSPGARGEGGAEKCKAGGRRGDAARSEKRHRCAETCARAYRRPPRAFRQAHRALGRAASQRASARRAGRVPGVKGGEGRGVWSRVWRGRARGVASKGARRPPEARGGPSVPSAAIRAPTLLAISVRGAKSGPMKHVTRLGIALAAFLVSWAALLSASEPGSFHTFVLWVRRAAIFSRALAARARSHGVLRSSRASGSRGGRVRSSGSAYFAPRQRGEGSGIGRRGSRQRARSRRQGAFVGGRAEGPGGILGGCGGRTWDRARVPRVSTPRAPCRSVPRSFLSSWSSRSASTCCAHSSTALRPFARCPKRQSLSRGCVRGRTRIAKREGGPGERSAEERAGREG